jgi:copper(I)-binding protein
MRLLSGVALALTLAASAQAAPAPVAVTGAWSRPAVAGTNGVGYMTLANRGKATEALVAVESPLAATVEMHATSMAGGVMSMARLDRVVVPAGGKVAFAPGAYHLMLIGLTRTVKAGDQIPATLTFASGAKLKTNFTVTMAPPAATMDHMHP